MFPNKIRTVLTGAVTLATAVVLVSPQVASAAPSTGATQSPEVTDEVTRALQRDLGLSPEQVTWQLAAQKKARQLNAELAPRLGDDFAGSWYDQKSGKLVVAVSSAKRSADVRDAGATPVVVANSQASLEAVEHELDTLAATDRSAAGITSWRIDPQRNAVVVTVLKGRSRTAALNELGRSVQLEETAAAPTLAQEWLDGGNPYNGCSVGFNAVDGAGTPHFVTAGHCGNVGDATSSNGVNIGPFVASRFPGKDYAAVRVDNTVVDNWYVDRAPEGTFMCKSGRTTGLTCGEVTASSVDVTYVDGNGNPIGTVNGLTQHNACVEPGDSGGSNISTFTPEAHVHAEGVTSGAVMPDNRCLEVIGEENVSWYQPVFEALDEYGLALLRA
jgi:streptogrisin C